MKPNILFVFADQWRAQATGYAGDPNASTPNLDKLASESANFANAVSGCPVCCPARASFLTGQYPHKHGVFINDVCLNNDAVSIAEAFNEAGYDTGFIGKWHVDGHGRSQPIAKERRHGFEFWRTLECTHDYNDSPYYTEESDEKHFWKGYDAVSQTDAAIDYINSDREKPFFLALSWGPPHSPYETAPEKYREKYKPENIILRPNVPPETASQAREELAGYYAHIEALDEQVGRLMSAVKSANIAENTIIVFWSDHGDMHGSQGHFRKLQPWDESILVPLLIKIPGQNPSEFTVPINSPDIMPTLLGLCRISIPQTCDGEDFSGKILHGEKAPSDAALIGIYTATSENLPGGKKTSPAECRGLRSDRYTYVKKAEGSWLLYDNTADPYQLNNLIDSEPGLLLELDSKLKDLMEKHGDKFESGAQLINQWGYELNEDGIIPYEE